MNFHKDGQHVETANCFDRDGAPESCQNLSSTGFCCSRAAFMLSSCSSPLATDNLRKFQAVSFNGSEPLDEVTKLQDIEGMASGKMLGNLAGRAISELCYA